MKGWKTVVIGALITVLGSIQATDLATIIPADWTGIAIAAIGALMMFLRTVSNTPVLSSTK